MIIDREYPATHSMSTAWFCADMDGNVAIIDIGDEGPVPVGCDDAEGVDTFIWYAFSSENKADGIADLNITPEQYESMLMPIKRVDKWEENTITWTEDHAIIEETFQRNFHWHDVIIKIDIVNLPFLQHVLSMEEYVDDPVCLSRDEGLFFVNLITNKDGVDLLEENHVIKAKFKAPFFYDEDREPEEIKDIINCFQIFIYHQSDYHYDPAVRLSTPQFPMKVSQLPQRLKDNIFTLPVRFKELEHIQIAEFLPVDVGGSVRYEGDDKWYEMLSSQNETIYYGVKSNKVLSEEEMVKLVRNENLKQNY